MYKKNNDPDNKIKKAKRKPATKVYPAIGKTDRPRYYNSKQDYEKRANLGSESMSDMDRTANKMEKEKEKQSKGSYKAKLKTKNESQGDQGYAAEHPTFKALSGSSKAKKKKSRQEALKKAYGVK